MPRGQELIARLYLASAQTDHYILFLHGYNYPWVGALKYLPMLLERGFNVLVPDQQAQGESQGDFITFGALESDDALEWLTRLPATHDSTALSGHVPASWGNHWVRSLRFCHGKSKFSISAAGKQTIVLYR